MKAPRWNKLPCEVGPFARLAVAGTIRSTVASLADVVPGRYTTSTSTAGTLDARTHRADDRRWHWSTPSPAARLDLVPQPRTGSCGLQGGLSTMDRLRARALESLVLVQAMVGAVAKDAVRRAHSATDGWINQLAADHRLSRPATCRLFVD